MCFDDDRTRGEVDIIEPSEGSVPGSSPGESATQPPKPRPRLSRQPEYARQYYSDNLEKERERSRQYRAANLEKVRERDRKRYAANPGKKRERERRRFAANPEQYRATNRRGTRKRRLGVSAEYMATFGDDVNGNCAICNKTAEANGRALAVDHDHATGVVRGVLCHHCNKALGGFRDNIRLLYAAADYLFKHNASHTGPWEECT